MVWINNFDISLTLQVHVDEELKKKIQDWIEAKKQSRKHTQGLKSFSLVNH